MPPQHRPTRLSRCWDDETPFGRRDLCKVKLHYTTGAKTCILNVTVQYKSRRSTTLVYQFGQTVCS